MTLVVQTERLRTALADRYRVERKLGSGGMATVYLAEDLRHGRKVAIKVLEPALAAVLGVERFLREIEIAAKLTHPHILPLHDSGDAEGLLYYVMPYVDGESLRERLAREKQPPLSDTTRILREVVDALAYAHANGVVHRDIKPDNVMLSGRHALVADFGIAKALSEVSDQQQLTSFGVAIGTPAYMAPEQAAGDADIDHRADIYSVGIVAYEMLAGRPPFSGSSIQQLLRAQMEEVPEPIGQSRPDIPPSLASAVMRCLAKSRSERWQSASALLAELEAVSTPGGGSTAVSVQPVVKKRASRRSMLLVAGGVLAALACAAWAVGLFGVRKDERWLRTEILPEIHRLADSDQPLAAHLLAMKADAARPGDPALVAAWKAFAGRVTITSDPPGARVSIRDYDSVNPTWHELGTTPLKNVWFPRDGFYQLRLELDGYRPYEAAGMYWWLIESGRFPLDRVGTLSDGLVHIPALAPAEAAQVKLGDYLLDRYEVTNKRYKVFVDAGGYQRPELWRFPFVDGGHSLTFAQAMAQFTDRTGRPGPSTWELSDFPKDQGDYPVSGVSWFEAAAYAAFEGRDLPTVYHWSRAAGAFGARWMVPGSNFADKGPAPVGQYKAISRFGAFDMAGNVREWCFNEQVGADNGRFILGGGWNDAPYAYVDRFAQSPWDRSATNGFRLATYKDDAHAMEPAKQPIARVVRDFFKEKPVSDAEFKVYLRQYAYDHRALNAVIEQSVSSEDWTRQKVTFDAAYGKERMIAYVYVPKKGTPPFQPIVLFPGSGAIFENSIEQELTSWDYIVRTGRVLVFPVYRGTLERRTSDLTTDEPNDSASYRDYVIQWARDLGRTIDYLETRDDIDSGKVGYLGISWGGMLGGLMPAVEPRLKAAVLLVAGLAFDPVLPEADPFNFLPRVTIPVLMLNGRLDHFFPPETSQVPMFRLLGTPSEHKRQLIYDAGHLVPRSRVMKETLDWYDKYLGPVRNIKSPAQRTN
jgi:eukaryotic-like serine/threonine-protein kinase